ncbi:MAG TPA: hypothetical protein VIP46_10395, partial [Pyrinomonadaceae bacterium]
MPVKKLSPALLRARPRRRFSNAAGFPVNCTAQRGETMKLFLAAAVAFAAALGVLAQTGRRQPQ